MKKILTILAIIAGTTFCYSQDKPKCKATTKAGTQCKIAAKKDGYCYIHSPDTPRCGAPKKSGGNCRMLVSKAGDKCKYHG